MTYAKIINGKLREATEIKPVNIEGWVEVDIPMNELAYDGENFYSILYVEPIHTEPTVEVPHTIQKWQAELILHDMGMLPSIQALISADTAMSIVYQGVTTFDRTNGLITQVATLQNISVATIDKMFIAASRYTAEMATDQSAREAIMREVGLL